jgi:uncharacterized membrane protein YdbT with pleckstrin-like domain
LGQKNNNNADAVVVVVVVVIVVVLIVGAVVEFNLISNLLVGIKFWAYEMATRGSKD